MAAPVSTRRDVAMALGSLGPEVLARLVGAPQDLMNLADRAMDVPGRLLQSGIEGGARLVGADRAADFLAQAYENQQAPAQLLPTSREVKQGADAAVNRVAQALGGEGESSLFYQPQTFAGRLTQEAGVGALGGGLTRAGALSGASSGVGGESLRTVFEGTPLETAANIGGSVLGAGVPAALGMARVTNPGAVLERQLEGISPQQLDAAQDLMNTARQAGVPLTGPEAIQQVAGGQTRLGVLQRQVELAPGGEPVMRPVIAARPAQVRQAGEDLLTTSFGRPAAPEAAVNATRAAAERVRMDATRARTEATQPAFSAARQAPAAPEVAAQLDDLKKAVDAEIQLTGADNPLGRKLSGFRKLLDQGVDETGAVRVGPLIETNRTYAENLFKKYNPLDPENTFNNREVAALTPLNKRLQEILEGTSGDYARGLAQYRAMSPRVNALEEGAVGRLAADAPGAPDTRLQAMANEFLDPTLARPAQVAGLVNEIAAVNPQAVPQLIGARMENIFNNATKSLQSGPNPFGGARFVTEVMGNPQARANLEATVKALPGGDRIWPGWVKFSQIMEATGKRLPRGSDTQTNLGVSQELRQATNLPARFAANPLGAAADTLEEYAVRTNSRQLAEIFTHPEAVTKMREMALLAPASRRARLLATEVLALVNAENRQQQPEAPPPASPALPEGFELEEMNAAGTLPPGFELEPEAAPAESMPVPPLPNISAADRDLMIRTVIGEARGEPADGQAAVAWTILNRLGAGRYGETARDVVLARNQFEPWNNPRTRLQLEQLDPGSPEYQQVAQVVDAVLGGQMADPTGGATHFVAPVAQRNLGRQMPSWARNALAQVGGHVFYAPDS